jgi:REP element-mobilizing transposase RayT
VGNAHGSQPNNRSDPERVEPHERLNKMAQTLTSLLVHIVFSTKYRQPLIYPEIEPQLYAYIGGILRNNNSRLLAAGGIADHIHLLLSQSKNLALSELVMDVKKDSSSWIKTQDRALRNFHWQDGYGGFSVGMSEVPRLKAYIANQKEHHRKITFQEELLGFLNEYGIEYDERYLWN